jgi:hypothetical protein
LVNRLVGVNAGDKIKALAPEVAGTTATRWRIGNRIYATLDRASGSIHARRHCPATRGLMTT